MELHIQDLVDSIKRDGVQEAQRQAAQIISEATMKAEQIVRDGEREAAKIVEQGRKEATVHRADRVVVRLVGSSRHDGLAGRDAGDLEVDVAGDRRRRELAVDHRLQIVESAHRHRGRELGVWIDPGDGLGLLLKLCHDSPFRCRRKERSI